MIDATGIKNSERKNELILYVNGIGCKAIFSEEIKGLGIECKTRKQESLINQKIKELKGKE